MLAKETKISMALDLMKMAGTACLPVIAEDGSIMGQFNQQK